MERDDKDRQKDGEREGKETVVGGEEKGGKEREEKEKRMWGAGK